MTPADIGRRGIVMDPNGSRVVIIDDVSPTGHRVRCHTEGQDDALLFSRRRDGVYRPVRGGRGNLVWLELL